MDPKASLNAYLSSKGKVAVAYSGGFDSTLLLSIAAEALPDGHLGVFVDSPLISQRQRDSAFRIADSLGLRIAVVRLEWEDMPGVEENGPERCYHCKRAIYRAVRKAASDNGIDVCIDGENADDLYADRPGRKAAKESGMISLLSDLGIGRVDVERMVRSMDIPETIVKDTCMATRIMVGIPLSEEGMRFVEDCESFVRNVTGVKQLRMRLSGKDATLLTSPEEIPLLVSKEAVLAEEFGKKGLNIVIDEIGYTG